MRNHRPMTPIRSILVMATLLGGLAACGSDGDSPATPASAPATGGSDAPASEESTPAPAEATTESGPGSGTLTMADGTVYTFEMSTCDTSENGAEGFVLPDTYDLFGATSDDAFRVQIIRAGLEEDFVVEQATLEGGFDENGKNATLLYTKVLDTLALTVDGGNVAGTVTMKPIGPNRPHGDEIGAIVDVRC